MKISCYKRKKINKKDLFLIVEHYTKKALFCKIELIKILGKRGLL